MTLRYIARVMRRGESIAGHLSQTSHAPGLHVFTPEPGVFHSALETTAKARSLPCLRVTWR